MPQKKQNEEYNKEKATDDLNAYSIRYVSSDKEELSSTKNEKILPTEEKNESISGINSSKSSEGIKNLSDQKKSETRAYFVFGDSLPISSESVSEKSTSQVVPFKEKWIDQDQQSISVTEISEHTDYSKEDDKKKEFELPHRKVSLATPISSERMPLKGTKSDAFLLKLNPKQYARSLSKSDLIELKRSMVKSDFKPVQDPLSAPKLRKNHSFDCHPCHNPLYDLESPSNDYHSFYSKPSFRGCESVIDSEEGDLSRPSVLFPSIRLVFINSFS